MISKGDAQQVELPEFSFNRYLSIKKDNYIKIGSNSSLPSGVAIFCRNVYSTFRNYFCQIHPAATGPGTRWQVQRLKP
jgi:hypothetical protein